MASGRPEASGLPPHERPADRCEERSSGGRANRGRRTTVSTGAPHGATDRRKRRGRRYSFPTGGKIFPLRRIRRGRKSATTRCTAETWQTREHRNDVCPHQARETITLDSPENAGVKWRALPPHVCSGPGRRPGMLLTFPPRRSFAFNLRAPWLDGIGRCWYCPTRTRRCVSFVCPKKSFVLGSGRC